MNDVLGGADESREALKQGHPQQSPEQFSETNAGWLHRRAFLAAGATATVLAASPSFAQNQPPVASAPTGQGAMPNNVRVERLDGSILLIGIRQESDRVELSSVIGFGRLMYILDHHEAMRVAGLYSPGPPFVGGILHAQNWA